MRSKKDVVLEVAVGTVSSAGGRLRNPDFMLQEERCHFWVHRDRSILSPIQELEIKPEIPAIRRG